MTISWVFIPFISFSQKIFTTDYPSQSDIKVFVVDYESQSDLKSSKWIINLNQEMKSYGIL